MTGAENSEEPSGCEKCNGSIDRDHFDCRRCGETFCGEPAFATWEPDTNAGDPYCGACFGIMEEGMEASS